MTIEHKFPITEKTKKVLYLNFDVGGGVEYCGNVIGDWIKEMGFLVNEIKMQDPPTRIFKHFEMYRPDIVIINDLFDKSVIPTYYYRYMFPNTRVVVICHSWKEINYLMESMDHKRIHDTELFALADVVLCVNYNSTLRWSKRLPGYVVNKFMPCNPDIFKPKIPWTERKKLFCYIGQIHPLKFSERFIDIISGSAAVQIDCYGFRWNKDELKDYYKKFDTTRSITYKGMIDQDLVADVLNEYKFYVMPHTGYEIFNFALMQAIFCGTIPLVSLDKNGTFDHTWIHWAQGLINQCNTEMELFNNLREVKKEPDVFADQSSMIVERANERFDYVQFKKEFQEILAGLIPERK